MHLNFFGYCINKLFLKTYIIVGDNMEDILNKLDKNTVNTYSKILANLSPLEFSTLGCAIAIILINTLTPNEQNTIGNLLEMIGQILLTNYAQASVVDPNVSPISQNEFNDLVNKLNKISNSFSK